MKVLLRSDVDRVGKTGDIVDVNAGFGRKYLVPKGFAIKATAGAEWQAESTRRARTVRDAEARAQAEELAKSLVATVITVSARAGAEGKLFGSVTTADIVGAVASQIGLALDRRVIDLAEPIKTLGMHTVRAKLHADVVFEFSVDVVSG